MSFLVLVVKGGILVRFYSRFAFYSGISHTGQSLLEAFSRFLYFEDPLVSPIKQVEQRLPFGQRKYVLHGFRIDGLVVFIKILSGPATVGTRQEKAERVIVIEANSLLNCIVKLC